MRKASYHETQSRQKQSWSPFIANSSLCFPLFVLLINIPTSWKNETTPLVAHIPNRHIIHIHYSGKVPGRPVESFITSGSGYRFWKNILSALGVRRLLFFPSISISSFSTNLSYIHHRYTWLKFLVPLVARILCITSFPYTHLIQIPLLPLELKTLQGSQLELAINNPHPVESIYLLIRSGTRSTYRRRTRV